MSVGGLRFLEDQQPDHTNQLVFANALDLGDVKYVDLAKLRVRGMRVGKCKRNARDGQDTPSCFRGPMKHGLEPKEPQNGSRQSVWRPHAVRDDAFTLEFNLESTQ